VPQLTPFLVDVQYREPEYERRNGPREEPYRWRYVIDALAPAHAVELAIAEFRRIAAISSVSWQRDIVSIAVASRAA